MRFSNRLGRHLFAVAAFPLFALPARRKFQVALPAKLMFQGTNRRQGGYAKSLGLKGVILYRNMLTIPQYRGSIYRVPPLPNPPWPLLDEYEASLFIGDYAPSGQIVLNTTFIDSPPSIFN